MNIQVLSVQLASQIAAGEVVERPSSVVKELVENALDAGATTINVTVRGGGREMIQVADNGSGIPAPEIETAFQRHATSKLSTAADLAAIQTLGFRGEALAAIAAVSNVTVVSRAQSEQAGTRLQLQGGQRIAREPVGAPDGTVIAVENLFFNTPARLKFLKSLATERRLIDELIVNYALAYPEVRFRLAHENRITLQTTGNGRIEDVLIEMYGADLARSLMPVGAGPAANQQEIAVSGFVGPPDLNWANRSHILLFVNGRWIKDASLSYAAIQAYHTLLPSGRFPLAIIFVEIPFEDVDVNVHPAKTEVRFKQPNAVFSAIQRAVRETLLADSPIPTVHGWSLIGAQSRSGPAVDELRWPRTADQGEFRLDWRTEASEFDLGSPAAPETGQTSAADQLEESSGWPLPIMRVIGQVGQAYIIAEGPQGLYLIDQHAAHERVLYEKFMAELDNHAVASQGLVVSQSIALTPAQASLLEENLDHLRAIGFELESFGPQTFQLRAVPVVVARLDPADAVRAVVEDLEQGDLPLHGKVEARIVLRVCKSAAVKAGQTLSQAEMEALIRQLEASSNPHTCPHGRPTMIHLSASQLAREFGRT